MKAFLIWLAYSFNEARTTTSPAHGTFPAPSFYFAPVIAMVLKFWTRTPVGYRTVFHPSLEAAHCRGISKEMLQRSWYENATGVATIARNLQHPSKGLFSNQVSASFLLFSHFH